MLFNIGKQVCEDLDKVFKFKYRDVKGHVLTMTNPEAQRLYVQLLVNGRGYDDFEVRGELRKFLSGELGGTCEYTGDLIPEIADYIIFLPKPSDATPYVLGEEVAHGEYATEHIRDIGCPYKFQDKFTSPIEEFMGMLGINIIAMKQLETKKHKKIEIKYAPPRFIDGIVSQNDLEHWIGYAAANQLVRANESIPFSGLFHAEDQKKVWSMVKEIITPSINFPLPEDADRDKTYATVMKTLKECELDVPFEFA